MSRLGERSAAARRQRAANQDADETDEALRACVLDTPEDVDEYLRAMARYAIKKDDPRWLSGAARIVETSKANERAKGWRTEAKALRKKYGVKPNDAEGIE